MEKSLTRKNFCARGFQNAGRSFFVSALYLLPLSFFSQTSILPQSGHNGDFVYEISPDNKILVSGGDDAKIILYNLESAKAFRELKPHRKKISAIDFSPEGFSFLSASYDSTILIHDAEGKKETRKINAGFPVAIAKFNPKAAFIAAAGTNGKIKLLDENTGKELFRIELEAAVTGMCFSSNGAILFSSAGKNLFIHELKNGSQLGKMPFNSHIAGLRLSQNDKFLLINLADGTTDVFDLGALASVGDLKNVQTSKGYFAPEISSDGRFVFTTDKENHLIVYEPATSVGITYNTAAGRAHYTRIRQTASGNFLVAQDEKNGLDIIYFSSDVFDKEKGIYWKRLQFCPEHVKKTEFSNDGETLTLKGRGLYNFNLRTGDLFRRDEDSVKMDNATYYVRYFAPEKTEGSDYYAVDFVQNKAWKFSGGKTIPVEQVGWTQDTSVISFCSVDFHLVFDARERKILLHEKNNIDTRKIFGGQSGETIFYQQAPGDLTFLNVKTGKKNSLAVPGESYLDLSGVSRHGIYFNSAKNGIIAADEKTGTLKDVSFTKDLRVQRSAAAGSFLAVLNADFHLTIFDISNGKKISDVQVSSKSYTHLSVSANGSNYALTDEDNRCELYNREGEKLCTVFCTPDDGIIAWTENNYYIATKQAARNIVFVAEDQAAPFAVYDFRYNRPDIVLEKLKKADEKYLSALKKIVLKRSDGLTQSSEGTVPVIRFAGGNSVPLVTEKEKISTEVTIISGGAELRHLEIKVNGSRIKEQSPDLSVKTQQLAIPLVTGSNTVEISAVTKNGIRSEPLSFKTVCTSMQTKKLFVVSVGISRYKDSAFNLHYADKDSKDISELLKNDKEFSEVKNLSLKNNEVNRAGLEKIKNFISQAGVNDVLLVYVAGHGVLDKEFNYYFATYDMDFANPAQKGIAFTDLEKLLAASNCVRKLLFMDTCHSGELDKDELEKSTGNKPSSEAIVFRNAGPGLRRKQIFGAGNATQLSRELFSGLKNSTGAIVISSSGGAEYAMESEAWKNGLFTYCVLHALKDKAADKDKDGKIKVSELQEYVSREVQKLSGGKQIPTSRMENYLADFVLF
jgi:WD40 repeat protein